MSNLRSDSSARLGASTAGVFGEVMGLVALTVGFCALGAYIGRDIAGGLGLLFFILGFVCIFGLNATRESAGPSIGLLMALGLFLGLGLGGMLSDYASADPGVVWQAALATALFVAGLGSLGYAISADLSPAYRVLLFLLLGLIVFGIITLFASMPGGNVIYAVLGLVIFGGYVVVDFNRMRRAGMDEAVPLAAGIFLDIVNVFTFFLQLFGRRD